MKSRLQGKFPAQVLVAMALACASWHFGIRPLQRGLAEAKAETAAAAREIDAHEAKYGKDASAPQDDLRALTSRETALKTRGEMSADAAKIYEALGTIATNRNVRIERIEPARGPVRDVRSAGKGADGASCEAIGYSIEAVGEYGDLVSFVDAVQTDLGITKVLSVRFGPGPAGSKSRTLLSASIESAHFKLVVSDKATAEKERKK